MVTWLCHWRERSVQNEKDLEHAKDVLAEARAREVDVAEVVDRAQEILRKNNLSESLAQAFKEAPRWPRHTK